MDNRLPNQHIAMMNLARYVGDATSDLCDEAVVGNTKFNKEILITRSNLQMY
jgi:hypothetical protein